MRRLSAFATLLILASGAHGRDPSQPNVVVQWNKAALQGVRDAKLGVPMVARALAITHTCMYDAWQHTTTARLERN
jgi:hypothetical protein